MYTGTVVAVDGATRLAVMALNQGGSMDQSVSLGYVGVEVSDPEAFGEFLGSVLGLQRGASTPDGASTWRMDEKAQRIVVHPGEADDLDYAGFVAADRAAYDRMVARVEGTGAQVRPGTEEQRQLRRVKEMSYTTAPWGSRIEFSWGLADADQPLDAPLVPGGFVTGDLGIGHVVFMVPGEAEHFEEANKFATDSLGLVLSDVMDSSVGDTRAVANFYHCNGRHHSVALVHVPAWPKRLDHIMIETVSEDNVGEAYDRALAAGVPIARHLGKHPNDRMFSFYAVTPAGFLMEFGAGAVTVDDDWEIVTYDRVSAWGHHPS
jgi:biphenyl-2,3-diol 1,2-dioxygenase